MTRWPVGEVVIVAVLGHECDRLFDKLGIDLPCLSEEPKEETSHLPIFLCREVFEDAPTLGHLGPIGLGGTVFWREVLHTGQPFEGPFLESTWLVQPAKEAAVQL